MLKRILSSLGVTSQPALTPAMAMALKLPMAPAPMPLSFYANQYFNAALTGQPQLLSQHLKCGIAADSGLLTFDQPLLRHMIDAPAIDLRLSGHKSEAELEANRALCTRLLALQSEGLLTPDALGDIHATAAFNFTGALREDRSSNINSRKEVVLVTIANQLADMRPAYRPDYDAVFSEADPSLRIRLAAKCMYLQRSITQALTRPTDGWTADIARRLKLQDLEGHQFWLAATTFVNPDHYAKPTPAFLQSISQKNGINLLSRLQNRVAIRSALNI